MIGLDYSAMPQGLAIVVLIVLGMVAVLAGTVALFECFDPPPADEDHLGDPLEFAGTGAPAAYYRAAREPGFLLRPPAHTAQPD